VLCGNHDGPKLFEFMETILARRLPIWLVDVSALRRPGCQPLRFPLASGEIINVGAVPFVASAAYVRAFTTGAIERATATYADEVGRLEHKVGEWLNAGYDPARDIRIFAAHLLVDGAQISGSEHRLYVEREFATHARRIPSADYVAFGHIHKPQPLPGVPHGRYAGSPLPIDFGERDDEKCVFIVSARPGRAPEIAPVALDVGRHMVEIRGTLDEIRAGAPRHRNELARVVVRLETPVADLDHRVRALLPQTVVTSVIPQYPRRADGPIAPGGVDAREPSLGELFGTFLDTRLAIGDPARVRRYFDHFLRQLESGEDAGFPDLDEAL
jgi:exonuclease SbcD